MQGPDIDDENLKGLIPRMVEDIFNTIAQADESMEFLVQVSYVEIYREKIQDLLNPAKKNLSVRENPQKGVYIESSTEVYVSNRDEVLNVIKTGQSNRMVSATRTYFFSSQNSFFNINFFFIINFFYYIICFQLFFLKNSIFSFSKSSPIF